jgi:hypothetical protein
VNVASGSVGSTVSVFSAGISSWHGGSFSRVEGNLDTSFSQRELEGSCRDIFGAHYGRRIRVLTHGATDKADPCPGRWACDMLDLVLTGLFASTFVAVMVWPIFFRSRWNPSGRVCLFLPFVPNSLETLLTMVALALLYHWRFKWSRPGTRYSSYEEGC